MFFRKSTSVILIVFMACALLLFLGCGREKGKTDYELGKGFFLASNYTQAMIKLESWVSKKKNPYQMESIAMLAVMYRNDENKQADFQIAMERLKSFGESGMETVLKLLDNPTVESRLLNPIDDILIQGGQLSIGPLINAFKGNNWRIKLHAQSVLAKMGEPAIKPLTEALNDPNRYTKSMAIESLSRIGDKSIIGLIEQKLNDPDKLVQVSAAVALHTMGQENPTKVIINSLSDPDFEVRRAATKAMAEVIQNPPVDLMLKALKDTDADVRNYAAMAIGKTKSPDAVQQLVKMIKDDKSDQVRVSAGGALEKIGAPAVDPLIQTLKSLNDQNTDLIVRIALILGNIGDKRAIESLEAVYKRAKSDFVKNEVAKALNKIPN